MSTDQPAGTKHVPTLVVKQIFVFGSLKNTDKGIAFSIKNRLEDAVITGVRDLKVNDVSIPPEHITVSDEKGSPYSCDCEQPAFQIDFPLLALLQIHAVHPGLSEGKHSLELHIDTTDFGPLTMKVEAALKQEPEKEPRIPRNTRDDFSDEIIAERQSFVESQTGSRFKHLRKYSFDPGILQGNCEHFIGVAQVPLGIAGPIRINGEHAQGDFMIPLATTEGTLVASYNRGMKVINRSGGATVTVQRDAMQRAPVFVFEHAKAARDFVDWVLNNKEKIAEEAESTTSIGKLLYIDPYLASKFAYLRFNFTTGDAAGQNMVGRATFSACSYILDTYTRHRITHFYLESNLATDKKASQVNVMHTRGKRVTAEVTIPRDILIKYMRVEPEQLVYHGQVANVGAILSGANNNGLHSANGITAMFIATGQDVANVSESSAGIIHSEMTPAGDLYISITIPSLIIATYGGGTGLATQRECLEILGCYGQNKVMKLAEIIGGVVLAGEISLASAISSSDWVSSHERYGRNR